MDIFEIFVCLMALLILIAIELAIIIALLIISNKDKITKFFRNLFTKGKKKKLTEPEPVTEAPISSTPPHKRKRMRPPKPKRPKIELHPLCFIEKVFGWVWKSLIWLLDMICNGILLLFKSIEYVFTGKWFKPLCNLLASPLDKIDEDIAYKVGGAVLGIAAIATFSLHTSALDG